MCAFPVASLQPVSGVMSLWVDMDIGDRSACWNTTQ